MFSETLTETITIQNMKLTLKHGIRQWKVFNNDDILNKVEKVMRSVIQW